MTQEERPETALISIIVPVFNEEANIQSAYETVRDTMEGLAARYCFEIVFLDNHSTDTSFERLSRIAEADRRVRVVRFARNFGFQRSVLTGYRLAAGDAAIEFDCDLQDPPELIPRFLEAWERGHDVVVGVREERKEGAVLSSLRKLYYRILRRLSDDPLPLYAGDFRLLDRRILDALDEIDDASPYVRGLTSSLAARETGLPYSRNARKRGESKYPVRRLIKFAMGGILAHSLIPLRVASYFGIALSVFALLLSLRYIVNKIWFGQDWPSGFATLTVLLLFGIGVNGLFLGIIGEYVGRIYREVRRRPTTIVRDAINVDEDRVRKASRLR